MVKITRTSCWIMTLAMLLLKTLPINFEIPIWVAVLPIVIFYGWAIGLSIMYQHEVKKFSKAVVHKLADTAAEMGTSLDDIKSREQFNEVFEKAFSDSDLEFNLIGFKKEDRESVED